MMLYSPGTIEEYSRSGAAFQAKHRIQAASIAALAVVGTLTSSCSDAEDPHAAASYSAIDGAHQNLDEEMIQHVRQKLEECVDEAAQVSVNTDGTIDTAFLNEMKASCERSARFQIEGAVADARNAQITEEIIVSLGLENSK